MIIRRISFYWDTLVLWRIIFYAKPIEVTKEICENAQVLKETSEEGIKCGLYEIEKTERNGEKSNFKTCYFVYNSLILGGLSARIIFNTVAIPYFVSKLVPSSGIYFNYTVNFSSFDSSLFVAINSIALSSVIVLV